MARRVHLSLGLPFTDRLMARCRREGIGPSEAMRAYIRESESAGMSAGQKMTARAALSRLREKYGPDADFNLLESSVGLA